VTIPLEARLNALQDSSLFNGIGAITGDALRLEPANWAGGLYQPQSRVQLQASPFTFKAIPYAYWANRSAGKLRVWLREA
jgi:DUF1680 family protein